MNALNQFGILTREQLEAIRISLTYTIQGDASEGLKETCNELLNYLVYSGE